MPRTVSDGGEELSGDDISSRTMSRRRADNTHHGHKVGFPPNKGAFAEFSAGVKETFFADDPLREYKDKPKSKKLWLGLMHFFPMLGWIRHYTFGNFKGDFVAGLTIASLCIPQDIGYAKLAGLDPQYGLYSSFVPPLIYALMGSSRDIAIGPVAVVSLLLGTLLQEELDQLILANPGPAVIQKLRSSKFTELIGDDKICLSVSDAVKKFSPKAENA